MDNFVDVTSVLITKFSGAVRHNASENEISNLKGALGLCLFKVFFLINSVVVNADEVAYNISSVVGLASGRGRAKKIAFRKMRRMPKSHFISSPFDLSLIHI